MGFPRFRGYPKKPLRLWKLPGYWKLKAAIYLPELPTALGNPGLRPPCRRDSHSSHSRDDERKLGKAFNSVSTKLGEVH